MHRLLVTGTDTDVGKTRVTAALALAAAAGAHATTIVKLVQTGVREDEQGDAQRAGELSGVRALEYARFTRASDPWAAALADGTPPVHAEDLVEQLARLPGTVIAEGAGGIAVPLNGKQTFLDVAVLGKLEAFIVIGLRLGCINHTVLSLEALTQRGVPVAGGVLVERWEQASPGLRADVERALQGKLRLFGILPFEVDERRSVEDGARLFAPLFT